MNIRPRCREWLPLSTQQLRLRNLQAIQAVNLEINSQDAFSSCSSPSCLSCQPPETLLYYTLHDHPDNEAFYQSEKLPLRMHLPLKWAEIQCLSLLKSNANCVCIKIWIWATKTEHDRENKVAKEKKERDESLLSDNETNAIKDPISALTHEISQSYVIPQDKLLFTWGVYFSGLLPLSQNNNEVKCSSNSLIFQMNDEFFASPEHFSTENLRENLAINYERYSVSVPKCSDPTPDELTINSPHVSRSSSPTVVNWQRDLMRMSKARYTQLQCERSEVRQSYNLIKLLRLQLLQRQRLKTQRECVEMTADIKRLSLRCITKEQLLRKPRTTSMSSPSSSLTSTAGSQYHSMGRALSLLLAEQQRIDPHELLRAQHLQQQVESLKSKQRLLQSAQSSFLKRITYLRQQLNAAAVSRQQLQAWLATRRRKLQEDKGEFVELCVQQLERRHRLQSVVQNVEKRMSSLCIELKEIYPIFSCRGFYTICGVPFPSLEGFVYKPNDADSLVIADNIIVNISPMALSASLGYVAHLVEMISVVINRPLRNPIIHEGSHTRIKDTIKDIPSYTSREFPLYSRSSLPTNAVKYAVNLLNQNIAQMCYDLTGIRCDIRATIKNILKIFEVLAEIEKSKREMHTNYVRSFPQKQLTIDEINSTPGPIIDGTNFSRNSVKNGKDYASLSKSHSSVDMNHMQPPTVHPHHHLLHNNASSFPLTCENLRLSTHMSTHPIDIQQDRIDMLNNQQRICRSVGSYTDSEEERDCMVISVKGGFSNSDSNLTLQSGGHM